MISSKHLVHYRRAKLGQGPKPLPIWAGNILAAILLKLGPKGLEFGRYSLDYHTIRNWLHVQRNWGEARAEEHIPQYAKQLVKMYDQDGEVSARSELSAQSGRLSRTDPSIICQTLVDSSHCCISLHQIHFCHTRTT